MIHDGRDVVFQQVAFDVQRHGLWRAAHGLDPVRLWLPMSRRSPHHPLSSSSPARPVEHRPVGGRAYKPPLNSSLAASAGDFESSVWAATGTHVPLRAAARPPEGWLRLSEPGESSWWSFSAFGTQLFAITLQETAAADWQAAVSAVESIPHPAFSGRSHDPSPDPAPTAMDLYVQRLGRAFRDVDALLLSLVETAVAGIVEDVHQYLERNHLTPAAPGHRRMDRQGDEAGAEARRVVGRYRSSAALPAGLGVLSGDLASREFWHEASAAIGGWIGAELDALDAAARRADHYLQLNDARAARGRSGAGWDDEPIDA